jgi:hypothetical protein
VFLSEPPPLPPFLLPEAPLSRGFTLVCKLLFELHLKFRITLLVDLYPEGVLFETRLEHRPDRILASAGLCSPG